MSAITTPWCDFVRKSRSDWWSSDERRFDGLADSLVAAKVPVFGPSKSAARLEGSKSFMKDLCAKYGIPTAEYAKFTDAAAAKEYIKSKGAPIVVKTDGLAAGKGVIVALELDNALNAVDDMLSGALWERGRRDCREEFLDGEEASFSPVGGGKRCRSRARKTTSAWEMATPAEHGWYGRVLPRPGRHSGDRGQGDARHHRRRWMAWRRRAARSRVSFSPV